MACFIGTSGWSYPHWRGRFYPRELRQGDWLRFYSGHFPTVEINATFYRIPSEAAVERWQSLAPEGFVYAVKASRYISHVLRLKDCAPHVDRFLERIDGLGRHLGPILYQLPPRWQADPPRLADFAASLPRNSRSVLEFRDKSWFSAQVRQILEDHGLAFCIHDLRGVDCPRWVTGDFAYFRFHGSHRTHDGGYAAAEIEAAGAEIEGLLARDRDVYAYFNNDARGNAVRDADELRRRLADVA